MKYSLLAVVIAALALITQTANAETVSFDFASVPGSSIEFNGTNRTFDFPTTSQYDFLITSASSPDLEGLQGNIGGTFTVGTITPQQSERRKQTLRHQTAPYSVYDGSGNTLTANLNWKDIEVLYGVFGLLNMSGTANLSNITYSGSNSDLLGIKNGTDQTVVLTFQFSPVTESLTQLTTNGQETSTSYSGSLSSVLVTPVPEPSSCMLLVTAGLGLLAYASRRRRN